MFLKNKNIIFKIRRSKVTDYAALTVCWSVKRNSRTASGNTDSQWSKQEACFASATQVWPAVNHITSVTSEEC